MATGAVGVFGVKKGSGVKVEEVGVKPGVDVLVFSPIRVGVTVNVGVAMIGVDVGISVGPTVLVAAGVGVLVGIKKICSTFIEQEESRIVYKSKLRILFMGERIPLRLFMSHIQGDKAMDSV